MCYIRPVVGSYRQLVASKVISSICDNIIHTNPYWGELSPGKAGLVCPKFGKNAFSALMIMKIVVNSLPLLWVMKILKLRRSQRLKKGCKKRNKAILI